MSVTRGWTPLMQAIVDGDHTVAVADIDAIADGAISALSLACERGDAVWVDRLLAAGADIDVRAAGDRTMLHLAAPHGVALVETLLAAGARIGFAGGTTPLEHGDLAVLERLLGAWLPHGATSSAFEAACERGDLAAAQRLRSYGARLESALWRAAAAGQVEAVRFLLDAGATMDFDLKDERSPLMHAAAAGQLAVARLLIERGAEVNEQTEWFVTPLSLAQRRGDAAMVELLVAHGAKPRGGEPIHVVMPYATYSNVLTEPPAPKPAPAPKNAYEACQRPDPWVLHDLLAAGASPDERVHSSRPIDAAIMSGRAAHVALLVKHGANVGPDGVFGGRTPLMLAAMLGYVRCVEILADHDPTSISEALFEGADHPRVIRALVARGADPLAVDRSGDTLLHRGAASQRVPIDLYLELAGSHIATRGRLGWTPLHQAAMSGTPATIAKLIAAGAHRDARDDDDRTPHDLAVEYPRTGILEALG